MKSSDNLLLLKSNLFNMGFYDSPSTRGIIISVFMLLDDRFKLFNAPKELFSSYIDFYPILFPLRFKLYRF